MGLGLGPRLIAGSRFGWRGQAGLRLVAGVEAPGSARWLRTCLGVSANSTTLSDQRFNEKKGLSQLLPNVLSPQSPLNTDLTVRYAVGCGGQLRANRQNSVRAELNTVAGLQRYIQRTRLRTRRAAKYGVLRQSCSVAVMLWSYHADILASVEVQFLGCCIGEISVRASGMRAFLWFSCLPALADRNSS